MEYKSVINPGNERLLVVTFYGSTVLTCCPVCTYFDFIMENWQHWLFVPNLYRIRTEECSEARWDNTFKVKDVAWFQQLFTSRVCVSVWESLIKSMSRLHFAPESKEKNKKLYFAFRNWSYIFIIITILKNLLLLFINFFNSHYSQWWFILNPDECSAIKIL